MSEIRNGIRHWLAVPGVYDFFQRSVGAYAWHKRVIARLAMPWLGDGASVLDIGCGTADVVASLPRHVKYQGFDRNAEYIAKAQRRFADVDAAFRCEEFTGALGVGEEKFSLVLAMGVLHHLDDYEVSALMASVKQVLAPGGMLLTLDPVRTPEQPRIARFLVSHDRGKNVRAQAQYLALARASFGGVEHVLDNDPMYIPYTGFIMMCQASDSPVSNVG